MTGPTPDASSLPPARQGRGRTIGAVICFVLAALLTVPAVVSFWGHRTLTDTQRYVETVGPLIEQPQVQDAVATAAVQAFQQQVDVEALVNDVFGEVLTDRPRLQRLASPLAAAVNSLIDREVRAFVASDLFEQLWVGANTRAQQALIRVLEGDASGAVSLQGDQIVLDLSEVLTQVKARLVDRGLTVLANVPIPSLQPVVLMDAPQLVQARTIYAFAAPVAQWGILLVGLLYLGALLLARRRPTMTVAIGVAIAVNAAVLGFLLSVGEQLFVNALTGTIFGPSSRVIFTGVATFLARGWPVLFWLGVILVVAGWFAGRTRSATVSRSAVSHGLQTGGSRIATDAMSPTARWVGAYATALRIAAIVLGVVVLLWGLQPSTSRLIWSTVLVVVLLAAIEVLAGAGGEPERTAVGEPATVPLAEGRI